MKEDEITLHDLLNRARDNTSLDIQLRLQTAETHDQILAQIKRAVASAIKLLVRNRQYKQKLTEDQRTVELVSLLNMSGIPAKHDVKIGGHTDISIEMREDFLWIAEAKNWRGASWAFKGFRQLMTRYATGLPGQNNGAIILYYEEENASALLDKWRTALSRLSTITGAATVASPVEFNSIHPHRGTGQSFYIQHLAVPLYWNPEDA